MIHKVKQSKFTILLFFLICIPRVLKSQVFDSTMIRLSFVEAVNRSKDFNKLLGVSRNEITASLADLKDAKIAILPHVATNASYQRYSDITVFDGVLGESTSIPKPPNANAGTLGIEVSFNLYTGGRQTFTINEAQHKNELAAINHNEQKASIGLQTALQYLDLIRNYYQEKLLKEQTIRAQTRFKNINAFYANGKVTRSDLPRADVALSNIHLSQKTNKNDYQIGIKRLKLLLNLEDTANVLITDTASLELPDLIDVKKMTGNYAEAFSILKIQKNIQLQGNRTKIVKSFNLPNVSLFGGYGLNYPNTFVFPPKPQTVAVGLVGIKASYNISSLYQNKNKVYASMTRENGLKQQKEWIEENVKQEAATLFIKYTESIDRISVIEKSIIQAEANYKIQNAKYSNQLSLLTDLLEADNLLYEAKFNHIQANIAALSIYYRLLFLTGKI
ncbi:TolC family protein [Sphingobacterium thalpophilum]|uniref:TolC family protein n=1 Tax=Sphingobacterium thalpophilum TaxID=259 RepID=UPI0031F50B99